MKKSIRLFFLVLTIPVFLFLLISCKNKKDDKKSSNTPTYLGMEILSEINNNSNLLKENSLNTLVNYDSQQNWPGHNPNYPDWPGRHNNDNGDYLPDNYNETNQPVNNIEDKIDIDVITTDDVEYYVDKNEEFILQVRLHNPKNYEIQSFTLNGNKYSSYMFERGSDMENLYLKVQAPNEVGYVEYTIDAIKYIDGEQIRDVDLSTGEKTIKAGVTCTNVPRATLSNVNIGTQSFSTEIRFNDIDNISEDVAFYLTDGEAIVYSQDINTGNNTILIDNLFMNYNYQYGVYCKYDLYDGEYEKIRCLYKNSFTTKNAFEFKDIDVGNHNISFNYKVNDNSANITYLALFDKENNNSVLLAPTDLNTKEFNGLETGHNYILYVEYEYFVNGVKYINYIYHEFSPKYNVVFVDENDNVLYQCMSTERLPEYKGGTVKQSDDEYQYSVRKWMIKEESNDTITYYPSLVRCTLGLNIIRGVVTSYDDEKESEEIDDEIPAELYHIVEIPDCWDGYTVNKIDAYAFEARFLITKIIIPTTVKYIGSNAFNECQGLKEIDLPNGLKTISSYSFNNCPNLETISIPSSVTTIGQYAFASCTSLKNIQILGLVTSIGQYAFSGCSFTSINLPNSLTKIENGTFAYCRSLKSIVLPNSITSIGSSAFNDCENLLSISLPNSLKTIGSIFNGCTSLKNIIIPESVYNIEVGETTFDSCTSLEFNQFSNGLYLGSEDNDYYALVKIKVDNPSSFTLHNDTKIIGAAVFMDCSKLSNISLPNGLKYINRQAFSGCTSLKNIDLPNTLERIGTSGFSYCSALTSIAFPENIISIGSNAFGGCRFTTSIKIPQNIKSFNANTFDGSSVAIYNKYENGYYLGNDYNPYYIFVKPINQNIRNITINNSTEIICASAFHNCTLLETVDMPNSITNIGTSAFSYCSSLTNIIIPDGVTSIGANTFYYCTSLTNIIIPDGVTSIGRSAFGWCDSLTTVSISNSVTSIGDSSFYGCTSLTSISLPDSITRLEQGIFASANLSNIVLPSSLIYIDMHVFDDITYLKGYYKGSLEQKEGIEIDYSDYFDENCLTWYYFTSNGNNETKSGNWWYYDTDGITIIEKIVE